MIRKWIHYRLIIKSGLFDAHYYFRTYPDVRRADVNPVLHYITTGWAEGRNPSSSFSTNYYLENYPDVRQTGINPLIHYIRFGKQEGRLPGVGNNNTRPVLPQPEVNSQEVSWFVNTGLSGAGKPNFMKTVNFENRNNWLDKDVLEMVAKLLG